MFVAQIVFISLFSVSSFLHLVFAFLQNEKLRRITKSLPLLFLFLFAIFKAPTAFLVYIACFFCFLGDLFMLKKKHKTFFVISGLLFTVAHFLYFAETLIFLINSEGIFPDFIVYIFLPVWFVLMNLFGIYFLKRKHKLDVFHMAVSAYFSFLSTQVLLGIFIFIRYLPNNQFALMYIIGYSLFIISDSFIYLTLFKKKINRPDFYIMISYLPAQALIVLSLTFLASI